MTSNRIYNFSSGPATMPLPVLEKAREELLSLAGSGMSVMEMSHRSTQFGNILSAAERGLREALSVPDNYRILFLQGGASLQFSMVPMNLLPSDAAADYIVTGYWGVKAAGEAKRFGKINIVYSGEPTGYSSVPEQAELRMSPDSAFIHYTSNETIDGVEFKYELDGYGVPVVCDASSNILAKPIDFDKYALIYAGAQKNIGPSGVTVVIIRDDLLDRSPDTLPLLLNYRTIAENESMANTPNTFGIYLVGLVMDWLKEQGGVTAMQVRSEEKAAILYEAIDASDGFYAGHANRDCRSVMNVTFRLASTELDEKFCAEAEAAGLDGLRGHRSVGGVRASIYNAFPREGVVELVSFMKDFASRNG